MSGKSNDTRADDVEEARALLRAHVLRVLRDPAPKASALAVCHRFIVEEGERLARERYASGAVTVDTASLPFPAEPDSEPHVTATTASGSVGVTAADLAALPFAPSEPDEDEDEAE